MTTKERDREKSNRSFASMDEDEHLEIAGQAGRIQGEDGDSNSLA